MNKQGFTVLAPRLAGNGCSVEKFRKTDRIHWHASVEDGYYLLCKTINVVVLSMGGLLALKLAYEYSLDKLVSISTPVFLTDKRLPALPRSFRGAEAYKGDNAANKYTGADNPVKNRAYCKAGKRRLYI